MSFNTLLADRPKAIQIAARQIRKLILATDARIKEEIYGGEKVKIALYTLGGHTNVLFGIGASDKYCNVYLHHTENTDVAGLKLEGKGKHAKHVKISELNEENTTRLQQAFKNILVASGY